MNFHDSRPLEMQHRNQKTSVLGVYQSIDQAEHTAGILVSNGFTIDDLSILTQPSSSLKDFARSTKTWTGATVGSAIGAVLGLLIGIAIGRFVALGSIMGVVAGLGTGGALGAVVVAFAGISLPEDDGKRRGRTTRWGTVLLSVDCGNLELTAIAIDVLEHTGALEISSSVQRGPFSPRG